MADISQLFQIEMNQNAGPLDLYKEWSQNAREQFDQHTAMLTNIATVSKDGTVSNRNVYMQDLTEDGFIFVTSRLSRKHEDIQSHPQVSFCMVWTPTINGHVRLRQVRVEGIATELSKEESLARFKASSLLTKLRLDFCRQGNEIAWDDLKQRHEEYVKDHQQNKVEDIAMPDHAIYYVIKPHRVEYYEGLRDAITIGDRILFTQDNNMWKFVHIEA